MSEYQYYEFQAIDRPLTDEQQQGLRREHRRKYSMMKRLDKAGLTGN